MSMKTRKPRRLLALLLSLCMVCGILPLSMFNASAMELDAGTGTGQNPIPIRTAEELAEIAGYINSGSLSSVLDMPAGETVYYRLEADISLADYSVGQYGWTPIGNEAYPFEGHFDGNGHTISGMRATSNISPDSPIGLFGVIGAKGRVTALRIADSRVERSGNTGGLLAGKCQGTIDNCEASGTVDSYFAGGFVGNLEGGVLKTCLSTARVDGGSGYAGGLYAQGTPKELKACAVLSPEIYGGRGSYALGENAAEMANKCIAWDNIGERSNQPVQFDGAAKKSMDELTLYTTWEDLASLGDRAFLNADRWTYEPHLLPSLTGQAQPMPGYMVGGLSGAGTAQDPYTISSLDDLKRFADVKEGDYRQGVYFKLTADLDMAGYDYEEPDKGWKPLPKFKGIFDGGGHAIKNLKINRPDEDYVGFFSYVDGDAGYNGEFIAPTFGIVRNLGLENCDITGNTETGALAGFMISGMIERCYSTGEVLGGRRNDNAKENSTKPTEDTGGILGFGNYSIIRSCYSKANVRGVTFVGGISGRYGGTITDCYTTGDITGDYGNDVGGVIGGANLFGSVYSRCYSTSKVTAGPLLFEPGAFGNGCGTGGIAGTTAGLATDLVALNPSVDSESRYTGYVNKCVGYENDYYGDNERLGGWLGTHVNGNESSVTSAWDYYAKAYTQPGAWQNFTESGAWDIQAGKLPILKDVGGPQDEGNPPEWLNDEYEKLYNDPPEKDSSGSIYYIDTAANLAWCSLNAAELSGKILEFRAKELDLSAYTMNGGWIPIGSPDSQTTGLTVRGNNCVITGLTIRNIGTRTEYGLFGCLYTSNINGLHLRGVDIGMKGSVTKKIGILAGWLRQGATVSNCSAEGTIRCESASNIGGLIGRADDIDGADVRDSIYTFSNISVTGKIELGGRSSVTNASVGGAIGYIMASHYSTSTQSSSVNGVYTNVDITASIAGDEYHAYGGIIGNSILFKDELSIQNCYSRGSIHAPGGDVGGIVGKLKMALSGKGGETYRVSNCYTAGSLYCGNASGVDNNAGGIIGQLEVLKNSDTSDKKTKLELSNIAVLAERVEGGYKTGRAFGSVTFVKNSSNYFTLSEDFVNVWDGTKYAVDGSSINPAYYDDVAGSGRVEYGALTTGEVLGRYDGSFSSKAILFSDSLWKASDGWAGVPQESYTINQAVGRLPTLTMGGNADKHIDQIGDVPLYISMTQPSYITEFGSKWRIGVYDRSDLDKVREYFEQYPNFVNVHLARDIDMGVMKDFKPIGHAGGNPFSGSFEGRGHVIKGLYVLTRDDSEPAGLFGTVDSSFIRDLGLVDPIIIGRDCTGGLAGKVTGWAVIERCFVASSGQQSGALSNSSIDGWDSTGGLVGYVDNYARDLEILHCYTAISVTGSNDVGGLVGTVTDHTGNYGCGTRISDAFVSGKVRGASGAGGLIGGLSSDKVELRAVILSPSIEAPRNPETAGYAVGEIRRSGAGSKAIQVLASTRAKGTAHGDLSQEQLMQPYVGVTKTLQELHKTETWNFSATNWEHTAGRTPILKGFTGYRQGNYLDEVIVPEDALEQAEDGWYEIHDAQDWLTMCNMVNNLIVPYTAAKYRLMDDIDLGENLPIPTPYQPVGPFAGELDGNGKTVIFKQMLFEGGGLFGVLEEGAAVHDLTIQIDTQAGNGTALGGAAGIAEPGSTLENITVTGSIRATGIYRVGGVVGDSSGTVKNCVNQAEITAAQGGASFIQAGGVAGRQRGGVITDSRNEGRVEAAPNGSGTVAGGLVGYATVRSESASLQNSQNTGSIFGETAGGLIGDMDGGGVYSCASTGRISGFTGGGLVGKMTCGPNYVSCVADCYSTGSVWGERTAGGLFGSISAKSTATVSAKNEISRCYVTGSVESGYSTAGGVVGLLDQVKKEALTLQDVAALNPQVALLRDGDNIGAFVGRMETKQYAFNRCTAFDEMYLTNNAAITKVNGVNDCGKSDFASIAACKAFWNETVDFGASPSRWDSSGGDGAQIKLPTLLSLNGKQDGELPPHLRTHARPADTTLELTADKTELYSPKGQAETVVFTANIQGTTQRLVDWSCSDTALAVTDGGADKDGNPTCTLTIPAGYKDTYSGGEIRVTARLKENAAIASEVTITVKPLTNAQAPVIDTHPQDTSTIVGKPVTLRVGATSPDGGTLTYQWFKADLPGKDGTAIMGAEDDSYEVPATETESVYYYCVVTNTIEKTELAGIETATARSDAAQVTVTKDAQDALTIVGSHRTVTYGDADFPLQTSGGSGTGAVTWKSSAPDVVSVDKTTGKVTIHKAGEAKITAAKAGDDRYTPSSAEITITVNKAKLTVTADDKSREYGQANPALTYKITGFVKGENASVLTKRPTVSCSAGPGAAVGTHPITVAGGEAENYEFVYVSGTLTVTKTGQAPLSILQGAQISKTYGDSAFPLSVTGGSGNGAVTWASSDSSIASVDHQGKVTIHKSGSVAITATKAAHGAFVKAEASTTVTVNKATLTVTAANAEKHFGEENPALSYEITGFVGNEDKTVLSKQPAVTVVSELPAKELPVGSYVIKVAHGEAENYTFVYNNATLIVNKADQSTFQIEGGNPVKTYGDAPFSLKTKNGAGGAVTWKSGDETVARVDKATGKITIIGTGKVQITAISAETGNFTEALAAVTLTVEKAELKIKADPQTRVYGEENPVFTYRIEGFANGDEETDLDELPVLTADADGKTGVGSYAIRLAGGEDDNYAYILNNAELTITPRPVTIKADDREMTEGGEMPALTWAVTEGSLLDGDTLEGNLKVDGTGVGAHPITQDTPFANPNYAVTFLPGLLTVAEQPKNPIIPDPKPEIPAVPDNPNPSPPTGDDFPAWALWLALLSLCGMGGTLLTARRRKARMK